MTMTNPFLLKLYAPGDTDASSFEAAVRALEERLSPLELSYHPSGQGTPQRLERRDALLRESLAARAFPLLTNDDPTSIVSVSGYFLSASFGYGGEDLWYVLITVPRERLADADAPALMEALGSALGAYWGTANSQAAEGVIATQVLLPDDPRQPPPGLPRMNRPETYPSGAIPSNLAWLNYWSARTLREARLDPAQASAAHRWWQAPGSALMLQCTPSALDLDEPAHMAILCALYDVLPGIGWR